MRALHAGPRRRILGVVLLCFVAAGLVSLWWFRPPAGLEEMRTGGPLESWSYLEMERRRLAAEAGESGESRSRGPSIARRWVDLEEISLEMQVAALVAEDIDFFGHGAVDWRALREALAEWWRGEALRGASTISQQVAKNLFLSPRRSIVRKVREARLAWWLERSLTKRRILELYLNVVELGEGIFGVEAAARRYYGTGAARLDRRQAAALAAAIPSPREDNPATGTRAWSFRRTLILERMADADWLRRLLRGNGRDGGS